MPHLSAEFLPPVTQKDESTLKFQFSFCPYTQYKWKFNHWIQINQHGWCYTRPSNFHTNPPFTNFDPIQLGEKSGVLESARVTCSYDLTAPRTPAAVRQNHQLSQAGTDLQKLLSPAPCPVKNQIQFSVELLRTWTRNVLHMSKKGSSAAFTATCPKYLTILIIFF